MYQQVRQVKSDRVTPPKLAVKVVAQNEQRAKEAAVVPSPHKGEITPQHLSDEVEIIRQKEVINYVAVGKRPDECEEA